MTRSAREENRDLGPAQPARLDAPRVAAGHGYGNFKSPFETVPVIKEVMIARGVTPPPPMPRADAKGCEAPN